MLGYGTDIVTARKFAYLNIGTFTANDTASPTERFGVPVGSPAVRILGIHLAGTAVPVDPDGTMLFNAIVNDVSEGADDTIVSSEDLETLLTAANQFFEATLAAETTEEQLTLYPGDTLRFTLVSNSAAIGTNTTVNVCVEYILVPRVQSDEDEPSYVGYPSQMSQF